MGWRDRAKPVEAAPAQEPAKSSWRERARPVEPGLDELALKGAQKSLEYVGKGMQAVTDAVGKPIRAGIETATTDKSFGESWDETPSWKDLYKIAGLSDETAVRTPLIQNPWGKTADEKYVGISPAGAAAGVTEALIDPTTYIAPIPAAKAAGAMGKLTAKPIESLSPKVATYLENLAAERAVKAGTGQNVKALRKIAKISPQSAADINVAVENLRDAGKAMLKPDEAGPSVVGWFDKAGDIGDKAADKRKFYGQKIGDVGKTVDTAMPAGSVIGADLAADLRAYAETIPSVGKGAQIKKRVLEEADNVEQLGPMSFKQAQVVKNQFPFEPQAADALISSKDATNKIGGTIAGRMDQSVEKVSAKAAPDGVTFTAQETTGFDAGQKAYTAHAVDADGKSVGSVTGFKGPDGKVVITRADTDPAFQRQGIASNLIKELQSKAGGGEIVFDQQRTAAGSALAEGFAKRPDQVYADAKNKYGIYKDISQAGTDREVKDLSNRFVSPSSYFTGGAVGHAKAATSGDMKGLLYGIPAAIANKIATERGSAFAARSAHALSQKFMAAPERFRKWLPALQKAAGAGADSLVVTHHLLMQSDPEYRQTIEGDEAP